MTLYPRQFSKFKNEARTIVETVLDKLGMNISPVTISMTMVDDNHAIFEHDTNRIEINHNSWKELDVFQKRILIIHELLHYFGLSHDVKLHYSAEFDYLSIQTYIRVYGHDDVMDRVVDTCKEVLNDAILEKHECVWRRDHRMQFVCQICGATGS